MESIQAAPLAIFIEHGFPEQRVDLGEIQMNFAVAGEADQPALLLIPGQTQSWWAYESAMNILQGTHQAFAVDLRGQGRSSRTPGRYTLDNMGNDLVRFIDAAIGRPTIVSGNSSGGLLAAWLSAYARPGQIRGVVCEDPPLFASEVNPACGQSIRQSIGPLFAVMSKWLGDQWSIGDWAGAQAAFPRELPPYVLRALLRMGIAAPPEQSGPPEVPQNLKEYDPEWARAFWTGLASASCDHERMLGAAKVPTLITHHYREIDPSTDGLMGAVSDLQVARARELIIGAGQPCDVLDLPDMSHAMHRDDPERFARAILEFSGGLPPAPLTRSGLGLPA